MNSLTKFHLDTSMMVILWFEIKRATHLFSRNIYLRLHTSFRENITKKFQVNDYNSKLNNNDIHFRLKNILYEIT